MSRVDLVDVALDQGLGAADEQRRRIAAVAACRAAAERWLGEDDLLHRAVRARDGSVSPPAQADLEGHMALLDDSYWDAQDAGAPDQAERFGHARAAAAVMIALYQEGQHAAGEAIYEAHHATAAMGSQAALAAARAALPDR